MATREAFENRDDAVAGHVLLYSAGLYPVISELFFEGKTCGHILKKLDESKGLLRLFRRALPGSLSYVMPRLRACTLFRAPKERAVSLGAAALDLAIAVVWWCVMEGARRYKVEHRELVELFEKGAPAANAVHVVTDEVGHPMLLRVYLATSGPAMALRTLRSHIDAALRHPVLGSWVTSQDYGFAVLAPNPEAVSAMQEAVRRSGLRDEAQIIVGLGPTAETLSRVLKQRRRSEK